jgi:hypothetical protein
MSRRTPLVSRLPASPARRLAPELQEPLLHPLGLLDRCGPAGGVYFCRVAGADSPVAKVLVNR